MDHSPTKFPDRTSSLSAPTRRNRIAELEGKYEAESFSSIHDILIQQGLG